MVNYAGCCQSSPGTEVKGHITSGRGITIHLANCSNSLSLDSDPNRRVSIDWSSATEQKYLVRLEIRGLDRQGILAEISSVITDCDTNIRSAATKSSDLEFIAKFLIEVKDLVQLKKIKNALRNIPGLVAVRRKDSAIKA